LAFCVAFVEPAICGGDDIVRCDIYPE